jgi:hypothetical protein
MFAPTPRADGNRRGRFGLTAPGASSNAAAAGTTKTSANPNAHCATADSVGASAYASQIAAIEKCFRSGPQDRPNTHRGLDHCCQYSETSYPRTRYMGSPAGEDRRIDSVTPWAAFRAKAVVSSRRPYPKRCHAGSVAIDHTINDESTTTVATQERIEPSTDSVHRL